MTYVAQLLPDEAQAKVLNQAMIDWLRIHTNDEVTPEEDMVAMHSLYAKFTNDWHQHNMRNR
jgi:hypothetical protein